MKRRTTLVCLLVFLVTAHDSTKSHAISIDLVPVGNPGNAPDIRYDATGFGSVGYSYQIGKYEVTAGQYTEFLNAVAKADPNGLYNTNMFISSVGAKIQRTGSSPNYSYSVAADWANRPVNYVSFWDAARFANWLHNGQPTGAQRPGTTEDGAYLNVGDQTTFARQPGGKFFIPTEDEWYKAAYHDKTAGLAASYFDYPTGTNATPINTLPDSGNHANFFDYFGTGNNSYTIGSPYYRTEVGAFNNSASPYGTFDQGGNIWEWNETSVTSSSRGQSGGTFGYRSFALHASSRNGLDPAFEGELGGFRVASIPIPEPSTATLLFASLAVCGFATLRRRTTDVRRFVTC
jgi:formylglycine-generating enzyme required for sulfatase activity